MIRKLNELQVQGKMLFISTLMISCENNECVIHMEVTCESKSLHLSFFNVSSIKIKTVDSDMEIEGFEVIDNSSRGWEKSKKYLVNDFENETISFYCERFEVNLI